MLRDALATWVEAALVAGTAIPESFEQQHSGRLLLRMPKSLHGRLAAQASCEGVSLNQLAVSILSEGLARLIPQR